MRRARLEPSPITELTGRDTVEFSFEHMFLDASSYHPMLFANHTDLLIAKYQRQIEEISQQESFDEENIEDCRQLWRRESAKLMLASLLLKKAMQDSHKK